MKVQTIVRLLLSSLLVAGLAESAKAETTSLELTSDTPAVDNQELVQGAVRVVVNYQPIDFEAGPTADNLQLQLFYNNDLQLSVQETVVMFGSVDLTDLDSNGTPEVVVQSFTGGAHCCMAISTYAWQTDKFQTVYFDYLDGGGGRFEDLNGDGLTEFLTLDNAFFYMFSSYAGSYPPSLILTFEDGHYTDTTAQFAPQLSSTLDNMSQSLQERGSDSPEINGLLAGYVGQKIRLGQYQDGWDFMLKHHDPTSEWGLDVYGSNGEITSQYADFPTALGAFLTQLGYLDADGLPQPEVNRSPVVTQRVQ